MENSVTSPVRSFVSQTGFGLVLRDESARVELKKWEFQALSTASRLTWVDTYKVPGPIGQL